MTIDEIQIDHDPYVWMTDEEATNRYLPHESLSSVMNSRYIKKVKYHIDHSRDIVFLAILCEDDSHAQFYTEKDVWDSVTSFKSQKVNWLKEGF